MPTSIKIRYHILAISCVLLGLACLYLFSDRVNSARGSVTTADEIIQDAYSTVLHSLENACEKEGELTADDLLHLKTSVDLLCGQLKFFLNTEQKYELGDMSFAYRTFLELSASLIDVIGAAASTGSLPPDLKGELESLYGAIRSEPDVLSAARALDGSEALDGSLDTLPAATGMAAP